MPTPMQLGFYGCAFPQVKAPTPFGPYILWALMDSIETQEPPHSQVILPAVCYSISMELDVFFFCDLPNFLYGWIVPISLLACIIVISIVFAVMAFQHQRDSRSHLTDGDVGNFETIFSRICMYAIQHDVRSSLL